MGRWPRSDHLINSRLGRVAQDSLDSESELMDFVICVKSGVHALNRSTSVPPDHITHSISERPTHRQPCAARTNGCKLLLGASLDTQLTRLTNPRVQCIL